MRNMLERFEAVANKLSEEAQDADADKLAALPDVEYQNALAIAIHALLTKAQIINNRLDAPGAAMLKKRVTKALAVAIRSQMSASAQRTTGREAVLGVRRGEI